MRIYSLGPLCHLIAVPARTVGIRLLHLRVELPTVSEVVDRLEGEGGLVPGEVQWKVHYEGQTGDAETVKDADGAVYFGMFCLSYRARGSKSPST